MLSRLCELLVGVFVAECVADRTWLVSICCIICCACVCARVQAKFPYMLWWCFSGALSGAISCCGAVSLLGAWWKRKKLAVETKLLVVSSAGPRSGALVNSRLMTLWRNTLVLHSLTCCDTIEIQSLPCCCASWLRPVHEASSKT